jgi:putative ABC transport system substrate-binding protein
MRRRDFIAALGGAAALPLAARAQDRVRRIGVLMGGPPATDAAAQKEVAALQTALAERGWRVDRDIQIDYRWPGTHIEKIRKAANELVALDPDVILSRTTPATAALKTQARTIPIVFAIVTEPVATGLVESFARPGGNITGFTNLESSIGGKLIALLKEAVPSLSRIAILYNPTSAPYSDAILATAKTAASSLAIELIVSPVRTHAEIEAVNAALARQPGGGLVWVPDSFVNQHRDTIVSLAARHRLASIHANKYHVANGALMSYGVDPVDLFRRAGEYVDRILRGEKPADLPVQAPTKYELVINLKTAKTLGLTVPPTLLARADEVIE